MNPNRWQQIEEVFQAAIDLLAEDREKFLKNKCKGDPKLRGEVDKLLEDLSSAESFIEQPVWSDSFLANSNALRAISDSFDDLPGRDGEPQLVGRRIGVYELVRELGHGGMGRVFLARRADGEFQQNVAIKLIKRGMDSDFIIKRFRHERQILASFEHQFIARLLDGGTTPDGLPYFVMEFVEGDSLYDYCDSLTLDLKKRLEIFLHICSATSYAHEKHIIHRDIKPSNILVTKNGVPKLLDFGIAKILDGDLIHESVSPTASIVRLMTPDYASPEQVHGAQITPASDIYGLGILLYELLSGHRPYNFDGKSLNEISRVICEKAPEKPSEIIGQTENLLSRYGKNLSRMAASRQTNLSDLKTVISGNLDTIILKALAKEISDRYESVEEFSEDICRFLNGKKIRANSLVTRAGGSPEPGSNGSQKTTGKSSLAILPFKTLNLTVGEEDTGDKFLGVGLADALISRLSKVRSLIVRPTSSILAFEDKIFDTIQTGRALQVSYILEGTIKRAGERLRVTVQLLDVSKKATIWATSIDETIGDIFSLEDKISKRVVEALLPQLTGSELEQFSKRGTDNAEAFEQYLRGRYYFNTSTEEGLAKSFVSFHKAIAADPNYVYAYTGLADYYCFLGIFGVLPPHECFQSAIEMARKAVELDDQVAEAHAALGFSIHGGNFDWSKAEYHLSRSLELNPNSAKALAWFGIVRFTESRFEEGLDFARRAIELDPLTPYNHHNLGWGLYFARRFDESVAQYQQMTSDFPNYGLGYYGLSKGMRIQGRIEEAGQAVKKAKKIFGETNFVKLSEAETLALAGDHEQVRKILQELQEIAPRRFVSPYHFALVYCQLGDLEKALTALEKSLEIQDPWLNWIGVEAVFDPLRGEERFQRILETVGYDVFLGTSSAESKTDAFHNLPTLFLKNDAGPAEHQTAETLSFGTKRFFQKPLVFIAFGFIALLAGAGVMRFGFSNVENPRTAVALTKPQSIVILPFKTDDPADENLGIGLADALSNRLGYIRRLSVIAPNSGRAVKNEEIGEIGKKLNVGYIFRGTLTNQPGSVRVRAELINPLDEAAIWTEDFTAFDGNLFEIQTEIAEKIWISLGIDPLPSERKQISKAYTSKNSAYDLYLIGRYQSSTRSPENLHKAVASFSQAATEDPDFTLAYAGLADAYALLMLYEMPPPADAFERAKENTLKALAMDDNLAEAHTSLGYLKFYADKDRPGAELEFRRALQLNPSYSQAHHWFAILLMASNRPMEAIDEIKTAEQLDPRSLIVRTALGMMYVYDRQYDEALAECERVLAADAGFVPALRVKRWIYQLKKDYPAARNAFQQERSYSNGEDDHPGWFVIEAQVEALSQDKKEVMTRLDQAVADKRVKDHPATYAYETALAYHALGETEKALAWLKNAKKTSDNGIYMMGVDPRLENLKTEKRFQEIQQSLSRR